ncbi:hypothetical protein BOTBODRAFT_543804 [Botryobasidium botryosum FD-172 SS1]|uniref:Uncharacterized protein n=1 Tax=Botryobasidium botryosum (strain FD-172 SS1) TaxID=930990 RepID=A0A067MQB2_BOTB1|nr:hypothetical protein BOTBODRAFT_543804 [Botryobasidium botryosum FD-172 SS1]
MEDINATIRAHVDITNKEKYEAVVKDLIEKATIPREINIELNAHCECSLLAYHLQRPGTTPLPYIGVSKPLCFACRTLFELYNMHARGFGQIPFDFTGGRGKVYLGWTFLCVDSAPQPVISLVEKAREAMIEKIEDSIRNHVREQVQKKVVSNSVVARLGIRSPQTQALLDEGFERAAKRMGLTLTRERA